MNNCPGKAKAQLTHTCTHLNLGLVFLELRVEDLPEGLLVVTALAVPLLLLK